MWNLFPIDSFILNNSHAFQSSVHSKRVGNNYSKIKANSIQLLAQNLFCISSCLLNYFSCKQRCKFHTFFVVKETKTFTSVCSQCIWTVNSVFCQDEWTAPQTTWTLWSTGRTWTLWAMTATVCTWMIHTAGHRYPVTRWCSVSPSTLAATSEK